MEVIDFYKQVSEKYKSHIVEQDEKHGFLPMFTDRKGNNHMLYEFVETIEGLIDYDDVIKQYPNLNFADVYLIFDFLRGICQHNTKNVDIDDVEDQIICSDPELMDALRKAIADTTPMRTLELKNERKQDNKDDCRKHYRCCVKKV